MDEAFLTGRRWRPDTTMTLLVKAVAAVVFLLLAAAGGTLAFVVLWYQRVGLPPDARIRVTPEGTGSYQHHTSCVGQLDRDPSGDHRRGGRAFPLPRGGVVRSANITPDQETGIGLWDVEFFVQRFRQAVSPEGPAIRVAAGYAYLRALRPVRNSVEKSSEPTPTSSR